MVGCRILIKDIKRESVIIKKMSNYIDWLHYIIISIVIVIFLKFS